MFRLIAQILIVVAHFGRITNI